MFMNSKKNKKKICELFLYVIKKKIKSLFCPIEKRNKQILQKVWI